MRANVIKAVLYLAFLYPLTAHASYGRMTRAVAAKVDIQSLETTLFDLVADAGRLPTTEEGLRTLVEQPPTLTRWDGPYLEGGRLPRDPWRHDYVYRLRSRNDTLRRFDLYSRGEDGIDDGGENDDLSNWGSVDYYRLFSRVPFLIVLILVVDFPLALLVYGAIRVKRRRLRNLAQLNKCTGPLMRPVICTVGRIRLPFLQQSSQ